MPWETIIAAILGMQGGVHPALFLLVIVSLGWSILENRKIEAARRAEYENFIDKANETFEKRIEEQKGLLVVLERNVVSTTALTASVESRTKAINDLVQAFAVLVQSQEQSRERFKELGDRLERRQEEAIRLLRNEDNLGSRGRG